MANSSSPATSGHYLANFGVSDAKREKRFLRVTLAVIGTALLGAFLWYYFRTFFEERAVSQFLDHLAARDYKAAHAQFGCTDATPCRDYDFTRFMEDWGDKSAFADVSKVKITLAEPCGNTVWVSVRHPSQKELGLAVDPETRIITYAPEARCPGVWRVRDFPEKFLAFVKRRL